MSLTSVLKDHAMKERFRKTFPVPRVPGAAGILAPPTTKKYSLIGTAFDYVARFHVKQSFPEAVEERWIAEDAVDRVKLASGEYVYVDGTPMPRDRKMKPKEQYPNARSLEYSDGYSKDTLVAAWYFDNVLYHAKKLHGKFTKTGKMTRELIKISFKLATIDMVVRAGKILLPPNAVKGDIVDMENLFRVLVESGLLVPKRRAFLNPTFGEGSDLVGGADADLVIDDVLIDIKTTKSDSFTQDMYNQLLGYYALSSFRNDLGGITRMGIYFSRYGTLRTVPVPNRKAIKTMLEWFEEARDAIIDAKP